MFTAELEGLQLVIGRQLQLRLQPGPGVELTQIHNLLEANTEGWIDLGDLQAGSAPSLALGLQLAPRPWDGPAVVELLKVQARWRDADGQVAMVEALLLSSFFKQHPPPARRPRPWWAWASLVRSPDLTPPTPWPPARGFAMMKSMTTTPTPLVTREALQAFTHRLVERYAPEKVILFGSLARGQGRWDSDADILVVMPFEGRHLAKIREMRRLCPVRFPLDLLVRRPEEIDVRYRGGDPVVREALDHGELLHG